MSNVPKLRFKGFVGEYNSYQLGGLGEYGKSYPFSRANEGEGEVHHIHYGDIHIKLPTIINDSSVLPSITEKKDFQYAQLGDIVIADASEDYKDLGKAVCINDDSHKIISGLHTHRFSPNQKTAIPDYLVRYMQTEKYRRFIYRMGTGVSVLGLSKTNLSKFKLNLPPLVEQKKVSIFFNELEDRIERQKEKVELLKEQKKGYMQKIFNRELRFKDKNGNEFTEWKTKKLRDIAMKIMEKNKNKAITNVISNSAVRGLISQKDYFDKSIANNANISNYYVVAEGDFVYNPRISIAAPYGPVSMYELDDKGIVSPLYLCFRINDETVLSEFMKYYFRTHLWHKHIYVNGDQGARHDRVSIKDKEFFALKVQLPTIEEQKKIIRFLECISEKIDKETKYYQQLKQKKKALMQQMFI